METEKKDLWFGENGGYQEFYNEKNETLIKVPSISEVNLFLGKNNSRKSRFLRQLMQKKRHWLVDSLILQGVQEIEEIYKKINTNLKKNHPNLIDRDLWTKEQASSYRVTPTAKLIELELLLTNKNRDVNFNIDLLKVKCTNLIRSVKEISDEAYNLAFQDSIIALSNVLNYHLELTKILFPNNEKFEYIFIDLFKMKVAVEKMEILELRKLTPSKIYIPSLRMARNITGNSSNNYQTMLKDDLKRKYYISESEELKIYDGLDYYDKILKLRNSEKKERKKIDAFEEFISITFFEGKSVDLVADIDKKTIRLLIEGDEDRLLHDLGDGIQNLLILLYPIFICEPETWIFIEEPELYMHPGMQSLFIQTLLTNKTIKKKKLKFFIVTHSNHLLDVGINNGGVSFYTFSNKGENSIIRNTLSANSNILNELGVTNSSVLMSNCSVWVEGISDRLFINGLLKVLMREKLKLEFTEGYNYVFLEYAGNNLVHYDFDKESESENIKSFFLTNKIFLLSDKDGPNKDAKHKQLEKYDDGLNFRYQNTISKEIENLIPPKILKMFLIEHLKANEKRVEEYEIKYADYKNQGFGTYLESLAIELNISKKIFTSTGSHTGALTPYYKTALSNFLYQKCIGDETITWNDVAKNENSETVITNIYDFIVRHNR
ncbi:MAG: putative ATPase [Crocinitomicaceae bacterium]|jgi:predicted ATPase